MENNIRKGFTDWVEAIKSTPDPIRSFNFKNISTTFTKVTKDEWSLVLSTLRGVTQQGSICTYGSEDLIELFCNLKTDFWDIERNIDTSDRDSVLFLHVIVNGAHDQLLNYILRFFVKDDIGFVNVLKQIDFKIMGYRKNLDTDLYSQLGSIIRHRGLGREKARDYINVIEESKNISDDDKNLIEILKNTENYI